MYYSSISAVDAQVENIVRCMFKSDVFFDAVAHIVEAALSYRVYDLFNALVSFYKPVADECKRCLEASQE